MCPQGGDNLVVLGCHHHATTLRQPCYSFKYKVVTMCPQGGDNLVEVATIMQQPCDNLDFSVYIMCRANFQILGP